MPGYALTLVFVMISRRGLNTRATNEVEKSISTKVISPVLVSWALENGSVWNMRKPFDVPLSNVSV